VDSIVLAGTAAAILVGLAGTVVSRLPGVALIWTAVLVWASIENTGTAWSVLAVATAFAVGGHLARQLLAGRRLAELVAPARSLAIGVAAAVVGYLLARTMGLVAGFAAGTYLAEQRRLRPRPAAVPASRPRLAFDRDAAVELAAGLAVAATWVTAVAG
jgi:uncharacterized protein